MILLDHTTTEGPIIGFQRSDKRYTYLHWKPRDGLYSGADFHCMIADTYTNIDGIGPTLLVEWSEESPLSYKDLYES